MWWKGIWGLWESWRDLDGGMWESLNQGVDEGKEWTKEIWWFDDETSREWDEEQITCWDCQTSQHQERKDCFCQAWNNGMRESWQIHSNSNTRDDKLLREWNITGERCVRLFEERYLVMEGREMMRMKSKKHKWEWRWVRSVFVSKMSDGRETSWLSLRKSHE